MFNPRNLLKGMIIAPNDKIDYKTADPDTLFTHLITDNSSLEEMIAQVNNPGMLIFKDVLVAVCALRDEGKLPLYPPFVMIRTRLQLFYLHAFLYGEEKKYYPDTATAYLASLPNMFEYGRMSTSICDEAEEQHNKNVEFFLRKMMDAMM